MRPQVRSLDPGTSATIALTAPDAGEYVFVDEAHPGLNGALVVVAKGEE